MRRRNKPTSTIHIDSSIQFVRGLRVILDADLAKIYGIPTHRLNEAVKRNMKRFPNDFSFQLTKVEYDALISQIARSKIGRGGRRTRPYVFTEHGAVMAANILKSERAIEMSIFVVRAFIKMRQTLAASAALSDVLDGLEKRLTGRLDVHEQAIVYVLGELKKLLQPPPLPDAKHRPIGFGQEGDQSGSTVKALAGRMRR
jgi:hypothetical protein